MLEIKSIDDRSSPLTSLPGPSAKDSGDFTDVLDQLIRADGDSENEIHPRSDSNSSENIPKNTPTDRLGYIVSGSAHFDTKSPEVHLASTPTSPVVSVLNPTVSTAEGKFAVAAPSNLRSSSCGANTPAHRTSAASESTTADVKQTTQLPNTVQRFPPTIESGRLVPLSNAPSEVQDSARFQNQRPVGERPAPEGRGCRQAAGEGFNNMYPSPGISGELLPSGAGLPSLPPHIRQAVAAKSVAPLQMGIADDSTLLIR